jgi:hypothetical protein
MLAKVRIGRMIAWKWPKMEIPVYENELRNWFKMKMGNGK